ncbi:MAG: hypothetical protein ILO42_07170 [Clostridia bacterium]|nr:hypothetical protein [Clostridia bacterium]
MFKKRKKSCFSRILSLFFAGAGFLAALTVSSGLKQLRKKRRKKLKLLFWNLIVLSIAVPLTSLIAHCVRESLEKLREANRQRDQRRGFSAVFSKKEGEKEASGASGSPEAVPISGIPKDEEATEFDLG